MDEERMEGLAKSRVTACLAILALGLIMLVTAWLSLFIVFHDAD